MKLLIHYFSNNKLCQVSIDNYHGTERAIVIMNTEGVHFQNSMCHMYSQKQLYK